MRGRCWDDERLLLCGGYDKWERRVPFLAKLPAKSVLTGDTQEGEQREDQEEDDCPYAGRGQVELQDVESAGVGLVDVDVVRRVGVRSFRSG